MNFPVKYSSVTISLLVVALHTPCPASNRANSYRSTKFCGHITAGIEAQGADVVLLAAKWGEGGWHSYALHLFFRHYELRRGFIA